MGLPNYFAQKNLSLYELGHDEWLALPEPPFFDQIGDQEEGHWLLLQQTSGLRNAIDVVSLVELDGVRYKLDGKIRKALWQSGKLPTPEKLMAQVFEISQEDFSALSQVKSFINAQSLAPNEAIQAIIRN